MDELVVFVSRSVLTAKVLTDSQSAVFPSALLMERWRVDVLRSRVAPGLTFQLRPVRPASAGSKLLPYQLSVKIGKVSWDVRLPEFLLTRRPLPVSSLSSAHEGRLLSRRLPTVLLRCDQPELQRLHLRRL